MSQCRPCRAGQSQRMKRPDRSCWSYGSTCYKQEECLVGCESQTVIRLILQKECGGQWQRPYFTLLFPASQAQTLQTRPSFSVFRRRN